MHVARDPHVLIHRPSLPGFTATAIRHPVHILFRSLSFLTRLSAFVGCGDSRIEVARHVDSDRRC